MGKYGEKGAGLTSVGKRLRAWRKSFSLRLVDVSEQVRVSQGSLSDLENDNALPSAGTLTNLCLYTDLNLDWLLTGRGEITHPPSRLEHRKADPQNKGFYIYRLDPELKRVVDAVVHTYRTGDPEHRAHLLGFLTGAQSSPK